MLFSALTINAQTTVWDFGNGTSSVNGAAATTAWPATAGIGNNVMVVDNLGLFPIASNTNFGQVEANGSGAYADSYVGSYRFKTNGGSAITGNMPSQRYLYFTVDKACTLTMWCKSGGSGARTVFVSNGANFVNSYVTSDSSEKIIFSVSVPAAGKYYIYGDNSYNFYKIEIVGANVTTPALSTGDFQAESSVSVYANKGAINVSNVTSSTKVSVYSVLGSLVKSIETSADTSLFINSGLYIVKAQSAEGTKTTKVIVQ